jgi:voltage-dependent potassium channel beta subunit
MFNQSMIYRSVGQSGLKVSALSLGGWITYGGSLKDQAEINNIHQRAFEAGINFFDCADIYAKGTSEIVMGEALKKFPRHELVISSKVYWPMSEDPNDKGLSRKHIFESVNKSLKRLQVDYLDLYFCHRFDAETPLEETVRAMDDLVKQGKILYWGTSEWSGEQIQEVFQLCKSNGYYCPIVEQPQYSLIFRERFEEEVLPAAERAEMGTVTWSPLASGMLSGKYDDGLSSGRLSKIDWLKELLVTPENLQKVKALKPIAEKLNCSRSQLAIAWLLHQRGVSSVILGASSLEQLSENLGALKVKIDSDSLQKINALF